jgi:hypothetical protein
MIFLADHGLEFIILSLAVIKKKFKQISLVAVNYWYSAVYGVYAKSCFYFSKNQRLFKIMHDFRRLLFCQ